jgi:hypothetical protein
VAAALVPVPLLLRRATPAAWSLPAAAPLLGLATAAGAFPATAARLAHPLERAALGALGAWWLLLAEPLLHRRLFLGGTAGDGWHAITTVATSPAIALVGIWGVAALLLPYLVRGRLLTADVIAATAWAAALAAGTQAAVGSTPPGLVAGAAGAAALALALRASRGAVETR